MTLEGGDAQIFPKHPWLLKPLENPTEPPQQNFNEKFSRACAVTDRTFEMLQGRFRIIVKQCDCELKRMRDVIRCCVLLHNLCVQHGDAFSKKWELDDDVCQGIDDVPGQVDSEEDGKAAVRNASRISKWLWEQNSY